MATRGHVGQIAEVLSKQLLKELEVRGAADAAADGDNDGGDDYDDGDGDDNDERMRMMMMMMTMNDVDGDDDDDDEEEEEDDDGDGDCDGDGDDDDDDDDLCLRAARMRHCPSLVVLLSLMIPLGASCCCLVQSATGSPAGAPEDDESGQTQPSTDWGRLTASWTDSSAVERLLTQVIELAGKKGALP